MAELMNPYLDEGMQKKRLQTLEKALQPGMRAGTEQVMAQVSPHQRGRRGASLMRQVYQPAQQARANLATQMAQAGTKYAAEQPYRLAPYTGQIGGQQTQQAQQQQFGQGLATNQQALAQKQLEDSLKTSELQRKYYPSTFTGTTPEGTPTTQYMQQMLPWITQGYLDPQALQGKTGDIGQYLQTEEQLNPREALAKKMGYASAEEMDIAATTEPGKFADRLWKLGITQSEIPGGTGSSAGGASASPSSGASAYPTTGVNAFGLSTGIPTYGR